jgi:hypothetical protein
MTTFKEANQARLAIKMKLSNYSWYNSSSIVADNADYCVSVSVKKLDNQVRKLIPPVYDGIVVKTEIE